MQTLPKEYQPAWIQKAEGACESSAQRGNDDRSLLNCVNFNAEILRSACGLVGRAQFGPPVFAG